MRSLQIKASVNQNQTNLKTRFMSVRPNPRIETFAFAASDWKAISQTANLAETNRDEANCIIETWSYDPAALSDTH
ncbi:MULTISPECIES: hypothetical protein [unclassified Ochrobactrum]|uniref:hypothetical protein n=1 Tax=unclassified Ochrobactrum TaxID=239106 RepID=UPI0030A0D4FD